VAELHWLDAPAGDERAAEPGAESEEEHLPAPVAAKSLHCCLPLSLAGFLQTIDPRDRARTQIADAVR